MRVTVVHNAVADEGPADELDVLVQANAVGEALRALGHEVDTLPAGLELGQLQDRLEAQQPDLVFNGLYSEFGIAVFQPTQVQTLAL